LKGRGLNAPDLPRKTFGKFNVDSEEEIERRKIGLQRFMHDLVFNDVYKGAKNSQELKEFVEFNSEKKPEKSWMDNYRDLEGILAQARSGDSKRIISFFNVRMKVLREALNHPDTRQQISDAEYMRRTDLLDNLLLQKDDIMRSIQTSPAVSVGGGSSRKSSMGYSSSPSTRVFGETEVTKKLDNEGLLGLQQTVMKEQDTQFDSLLSTVRRQKEIGYAINDELSIQEKLLSGLEDKVEVSREKIKYANQRAKKLVG
jgi:regulator of vacuolar morphogenesis